MPKIGDKTEKTTLAGTEKLPIDGSQYVQSQSIANLGRTKIALYSGNATSVTNGSLQSTVAINTEVYDPDGLASVSGNTITIAQTGYYKIAIDIGWYPSNSLDFDGTAVVETSNLPQNIYQLFGYVAAWAQQNDEPVIHSKTMQLTGGQTFQVKFTNTLGDTQTVQIFQVAIYKYA